MKNNKCNADECIKVKIKRTWPDTLCKQCKYNGRKYCTSKELPPSMFDYPQTTPAIENRDIILFAMNAVTQADYQNGKDSAITAKLLAGILGECKYYQPKVRISNEKNSQ